MDFQICTFNIKCLNVVKLPFRKIENFCEPESFYWMDLFVIAHQIPCRSSHPDVFCKKVVLSNFEKFTGKHLYLSLYFDKVASLAQVFSCEFCEISKNTSGGCFFPFLRRELDFLSIFDNFNFLTFSGAE